MGLMECATNKTCTTNHIVIKLCIIRHMVKIYLVPDTPFPTLISLLPAGVLMKKEMK